MTDADIILALTGRPGFPEADLNPRLKRALDSIRRDRAQAAELTERWRGRRISGEFTYEWMEHRVPWEGVVERVLVGNPYNRPHARLTSGRIVPLPEGDPDA